MSKSNIVFNRHIWGTDIDRDVIMGMDATQMEESLNDSAWSSEADYHPFAKSVALDE